MFMPDALYFEIISFGFVDNLCMHLNLSVLKAPFKGRRWMPIEGKTTRTKHLWVHRYKTVYTNHWRKRRNAGSLRQHTNCQMWKLTCWTVHVVTYKCNMYYLPTILMELLELEKPNGKLSLKETSSLYTCYIDTLFYVRFCFWNMFFDKTVYVAHFSDE